MKNRGFTLIELLVTVSIIAVLSAIGLVIYHVVLEQGRDSKRQSDLRTIQSALEQYYADQFFYPTGNGLDTALKAETPPAFTSSTGNPSPPSSVKTYINSLPKDPLNSDTWKYYYWASPEGCDNSTAPTAKCTGYCIYTNLENSTPGTGNCTATGYNFAVTPP